MRDNSEAKERHRTQIKLFQTELLCSESLKSRPAVFFLQEVTKQNSTVELHAKSSSSCMLIFMITAE